MVNQVPVNNDMQYVQSITPPVVRNTELRPTSEIRKLSTLARTVFVYQLIRTLLLLASPFNSVFKFGLFNIIQSRCLDDVRTAKLFHDHRTYF